MKSFVLSAWIKICPSSILSRWFIHSFMLILSRISLWLKFFMFHKITQTSKLLVTGRRYSRHRILGGERINHALVFWSLSECIVGERNIICLLSTEWTIHHSILTLWNFSKNTRYSTDFEAVLFFRILSSILVRTHEGFAYHSIASQHRVSLWDMKSSIKSPNWVMRGSQSTAEHTVSVNSSSSHVSKGSCFGASTRIFSSSQFF